MTRGISAGSYSRSASWMIGDVAGHVADGRLDRGPLAQVPLVEDGPDARVLRGQFAEDLRRAVGGAVVDDDQLDWDRARAAEHAPDDRAQGPPLVVDRHQDAEQVHRAGGSPCAGAGPDAVPCAGAGAGDVRKRDNGLTPAPEALSGPARKRAGRGRNSTAAAWTRVRLGTSRWTTALAPTITLSPTRIGPVKTCRCRSGHRRRRGGADLARCAADRHVLVDPGPRPEHDPAR